MSYRPPAHQALPSFPTRRSSDLEDALTRAGVVLEMLVRLVEDRLSGEVSPLVEVQKRLVHWIVRKHRRIDGEQARWTDRKSTRLNSSHPSISYAVFCLKKKRDIK